MLKDILLKRLGTKLAINNAIITLGSIDDSGKGRHFKSRFIQAGIAGYPEQFGNVLIKKESLDKFINTIVGAPVIVNHKDITKDNVDDERVGVISNVWFNEKDGWYWCDGIIWDENAQKLIEEGWSVSCSYDVKLVDDKGGSENNILYDMEFLDGVFTHLALVDNPRYERANIVFNSKTVINNFNPNQKRDEKGRWTKDDALIQQKKDNLIPIEVDPKDVPQFETKEDLGNWFKGIFEHLGSVTIEDTGAKLDLYGGNANREAFKRRFQQEPNKAVAKAFEDVVTKSIKVDEREKDERHKHSQDVYYNKLKLGTDTYDVNLLVDYLELNKEYRYAGHSTQKIDNKMSTRDTQVINHIMLTKVDNSIINDINTNFNPNIKKHEIQNSKEQDMSLLEDLKKLITKAENSKGDKMDKDEKEIQNEKVDKRKLIDEVGGILKGKVDEEVWRTVIGIIEKIGYNDSEAGTVDNDDGKKKDEDDKKEKDVDNKKVKNESEEDKKEVKDVEDDMKKDSQNCKANNAKSDYFEQMNKIYNSQINDIQKTDYVSRDEKLKAAEEYFG